VTVPASFEGRERARLFCALRLSDDTLDGLRDWQTEQLRGRIVVRDHLHITLAFLGDRPVSELDGILTATRDAASAARPMRLDVVRYRETRSVGMLVLSDQGDAATELAGDLHGRLEGLGAYERERRPWLPHLTVLRFRVRPRLRPPLPELEPFSPSDAAVYHSVLRSTGAQYVVVESFPLGG
jgi:RNA 2',3'-cyclic 3'-phosphodiesterase